MLDVLDVIAGLALALAVVSLALVWAIRTAWRLICNLRDEETEHAHTRRRLADVEAIRRRAPMPPEGMEIIREAAEVFRSYEASHTAKAAEIVTMGRSSERDDRLNKADRNRVMAGKLEALLALHSDAIHARRELVEAAKRPAHGGYPDPIKARDIARSRPHLKAVDAGGCAPPIIVTVDSDRATDRAYADAGIMPVADYVAKHGGED